MKPEDIVGSRRVGLVISRPADRRLMAEYLEGRDCTVLVGEPARLRASMEGAALLIVDEAAAHRDAAALRSMKQAAGAVLLPILVLGSRARDSAHWIAQGYDDVLRLPIAKAELGARVEAFLRLRRQSQLAQLDSQKRFQETFDQAPVGIAHTDPDGRFLLVNRRFGEILGYSERELLERHFIDFTHPADVGASVSALERMKVDRSAGLRLEKRYIRKDARVVWAEVTVSAVRDAQGAPKYFIALINDITERRQLEERVRKTARARRVMAECNRILVHAQDEAVLLNDMCEAVVRFGDYATAWIGVERKDAEQSVEPLACAGANIRHLRALGVNVRPDSPQGRGPLATALRTRMPVVENDMQYSPHLHFWRDTAIRYGIQSALALPLISAGQCFGGLIIYSTERGAFTDEEFELLRELAEDLAYGIATLRTRAAREQAEAALRESERFARATIDALTKHLCVVDDSGAIIATNRAWREFAVDNGNPPGASIGEGANYLEVCARSAAAGSADAATVAEALRAAIRGEQPYFSLDYQCDSPSQPRWFQLRITRFGEDGPVRVVVSHENISARKQAEIRLRDSEARFRSLSTLSSDWFWEQDAQLRFTSMTGRALGAIGPYAEDCIGKTRWDMHAGAPQRHYINFSDADWAAHRALLEARQPFRDLYVEQRRPDGTASYVMISGEPVFDEDGRFAGYRGTGKDITELKRTERELLAARERLGFLLAATPVVIFACEAKPPHALTFLSENLREQFGYDPAEILKDPAAWIDCVHPDDAPRLLGDIARAADGGRQVHQYRIRHKDGRYLWVQEDIHLVAAPDGRAQEVVGYLIDIDDKKRVEERLLHLAHFDDLTQLPNRVLFRDRLTQAIAQARRNGWVLAVMFLDLDRFKIVNDTLGHPVGDELLRMVSERINGILRSGDTVGRLGGDEFALILNDLGRPEDAQTVAAKVLGAFEAPFLLGGREVYVTASVGVTLFPGDATSPDELIKNADGAMYRAKELGRNNFQCYEPGISDRVRQRLDLENDLRRALERQEFVLRYQPRVDVATGAMVGMEALLRWRRQGGTMIPPSAFIPLLEDTGLIIPVGDWVLREACRQQGEWQAAGLPLLPIAVNLSPRQLHDPAFVERVRNVIGGCISGELIELEITESSLMHNPEEAITMLKAIRALGVRLAIDDFGTGYSSLNYLKRFPLDCLKVDQSFVRDITSDEDDAAIVRTIISIARQMQLRVVAEGVETDEQRACLEALGCDEAQGFLFAHPLDPETMSARLRGLRAAAGAGGKRGRRPQSKTRHKRKRA